jgi:hypothetical protein
MSKTVVVNKKTQDFDEYCGRGTIFGNPFEMPRDGNREEVIRKYGGWFKHLLRDERFKTELAKLKGKRIACFCAPDACHLDLIAEHLDNE